MRVIEIRTAAGAPPLRLQ